MTGFIVLTLLFLLAGYPLYKKRWPDGFWPVEDDHEKLDRIRRVGRRRVLPLPLGREGHEREHHERHDHRGQRGARQ